MFEIIITDKSSSQKTIRGGFRADPGSEFSQSGGANTRLSSWTGHLTWWPSGWVPAQARSSRFSFPQGERAKVSVDKVPRNLHSVDLLEQSYGLILLSWSTFWWMDGKTQQPSSEIPLQKMATFASFSIEKRCKNSFISKKLMTPACVHSEMNRLASFPWMWSGVRCSGEGQAAFSPVSDNELCCSGMSHEGDGWTVQDGEQFFQSLLAYGFSPGRGTSNHDWPDSGVAKAERLPKKSCQRDGLANRAWTAACKQNLFSSNELSKAVSSHIWCLRFFLVELSSLSAPLLFILVSTQLEAARHHQQRRRMMLGGGRGLFCCRVSNFVFSTCGTNLFLSEINQILRLWVLVFLISGCPVPLWPVLQGFLNFPLSQN